MVHKEKQVNVNFNLTQINSWCINYNQSIQNKIKNKLHMKAINYTCFKQEEKTSFKKNKNNFINIIADKFAMIIRWGKLTISFGKKLFSCTNYFQLCTSISNKNKYLKMKWLLTHFMALVSFYIPWKHQETPGFLIYFKSIEKDQCHWNGVKIFLVNMSRQPVETNKPFSS